MSMQAFVIPNVSIFSRLYVGGLEVEVCRASLRSSVKFASAGA